MNNSRVIFKVLLVTVLGMSPALCQARQACCKAQRLAAMPQNKTMMAPEEQQFTMKLSALHRQIFMTVFTPELRKEAMALVNIPSDDMDEGSPITADMAVEEVISNHRDIPSGMSGQMPANNGMQSTTPSQGGSSTSNY